jgi:ribosomal protein L7/L12
MAKRSKKQVTAGKKKSSKKVAKKSQKVARVAKEDRVTVVLTSCGDDMENVKALIPLRRFTNLGLREAKNLVEGELPVAIPRLDFKWDRKLAERFVAELKKAGASAELNLKTAPIDARRAHDQEADRMEE